MRAWLIGGSSGLGLELAKEARRLKMVTTVWGVERKDSSTNHLDLGNRVSVDDFCNRVTTVDPVFIKEIKFLVWNAGVLDYAPFGSEAMFERSLNINVVHPTLVLRALLRRKVNLDSPIHLIVISSVASWRARKKMAIYSGAKAYQAQFARSLALDLEHSHLGSKVTIAMPAGIRTGIFEGSGIDPSGFMSPKAVAKVVWREALNQTKTCDWFNVLPSFRGEPRISRKNFNPELAYDALPLYNRVSS